VISQLVKIERTPPTAPAITTRMRDIVALLCIRLPPNEMRLSGGPG
jgi:hypothetical protein